MSVVAGWYYMRESERVGPMTLEELCALFQGRAIGLETLVWGEAFKQWVPASSIEGFRDAWGVQAAGGGVLGYESGQEGWALGGWLIIPAIGRVFGPLMCGLAMLVYWLLGERMVARRIPLRFPVELLAVVSVVWTAFELGTSVLFFGRRRAAVRAMIALWVAGAMFALMATALGWGRRPGTSDEAWWVLGVGPTFVWSGVWVWYFLASQRVRATFVR